MCCGNQGLSGGHRQILGGLCNSKQPRNNKSYDTLVTHYHDLLMPENAIFLYLLLVCRNLL